MGISADQIRDLHKYEVRILLILERLMRRYRWVPLDIIKKTIGLSESEVSYRLGRLMERGLVRFDTVPYEGYSLIFQGYDALVKVTVENLLTQSKIIRFDSFAATCHIIAAAFTPPYALASSKVVYFQFTHVVTT